MSCGYFSHFLSNVTDELGNSFKTTYFPNEGIKEQCASYSYLYLLVSVPPTHTPTHSARCPSNLVQIEGYEGKLKAIKVLNVSVDYAIHCAFKFKKKKEKLF